MTGASRALLPSSSNTCNSLSVVLGRPRVVPLREDCNRREKQMQKQAWQAPTSGSSTLAEEPTQHISNTCSSSHKSSDQQQQCSEARPVPSFRACACYQNTFFFSRPSLPREHCRVRCPQERRRWPPRLRPDPCNRDARQKNYNTGRQWSETRGTFLPRRSRGTCPYPRIALLGLLPPELAAPVSLFGGVPPESVPSEVPPTFHSARVCSPAGFCVAVSRHLRRRSVFLVGSERVLRVQSDRPKVAAGPARRVSTDQGAPRSARRPPPGNVPSPRCARCQRGPPSTSLS